MFLPFFKITFACKSINFTGQRRYLVFSYISPNRFYLVALVGRLTSSCLVFFSFYPYPISEDRAPLGYSEGMALLGSWSESGQLGLGIVPVADRVALVSLVSSVAVSNRVADFTTGDG